MLYSILFLFTFLIASNADFVYLRYFYRREIPKVFRDEINLKREHIKQIQGKMNPYNWEYLEEEAALYDRCGGNNAGFGRLEYYDTRYIGAKYQYLVKENTEFYCDLTNRLVVKTGSILDGCKAPETWYYKVPILDKEEDN
jgi:hypothetical protein